jgi:hypothetical protein
MAFEVNGKVGPGYAGDGSLVDPRQTRDLATVMQELHGRYYETTYRGGTFIASTGVGGVAPGTALGTAPPFTLYNPLNSGVNLVIVSASLGFISGTLGAGTIVYAANTNTAQAAPTGGTTLVPINALIGNGSLPKGKAFQGSTVAATSVIVRDFAIIGAYTASTVNMFPPIRDIVDGSIIVSPGASVSLQGIAGAGTTPLVTLAMTWEEVPV